MEAMQVMEVVTVVMTLMMLMTGIAPCAQMYRSGSTKNVPFHVFLMSFVSAFGMVHYGFLLENSTLIFINSVGLILQFSYLVTYLIVVQNKAKYFGYFMVGLLYLCGLYGYIYSNGLERPVYTQLIGSTSSTIITIMVTLPALEIIDNIRNKHADGMPAIMLIGGFACGMSWLIFGIMLEDPNVYMPNIPGVTIGGAKLIIVAMYGGQDHKVKSQ